MSKQVSKRKSSAAPRPTPVAIERDPAVTIAPTSSSPSTSSSTSTTAASKIKFKWNDDNSLELIKICHEDLIWAVPYKKVVKTWQQIADRVNSAARRLDPVAPLTSGQHSAYHSILFLRECDRSTRSHRCFMSVSPAFVLSPSRPWLSGSV